MLDRFRTRCHTKRDMLALQVGWSGMGLHHYLIKTQLPQTLAMGRPWPKNGLSSTEEDKTNTEIIDLIPK
jgi:hypothetical protein